MPHQKTELISKTENSKKKVKIPDDAIEQIKLGLKDLEQGKYRVLH